MSYILYLLGMFIMYGLLVLYDEIREDHTDDPVRVLICLIWPVAALAVFAAAVVKNGE